MQVDPPGPTLGEVLATLNRWSDRPPAVEGVLRVSVPEDRPRTGGRQARIRFWAALPDRQRLEVLEGREPELTIRAGSEMWEVAERGVWHQRHAVGHLQWLSNMFSAPTAVAAGLPELVGAATLLGREAAVLRVRLPHHEPRGGDREFAIDRATGTVLRWVHRRDGLEIGHEELEEVRFPDEFPAELFAFEPPAGTAVRELDDAWSDAPPLEDLPDLVPFRIWSPPGRWRTIRFDGDTGRIHVEWAERLPSGGTRHVQIVELAAPEVLPAGLEEMRVAGQSVLVHRDAGRSSVLMVRDGTLIVLSAAADPQEMASWGLALIPLDAEPAGLEEV